ncbi:CD225/dispanin family protein [Dysgonomonas sp. 25]|uniref:CD225/dispanin family protein n=1 Tax=Dysgonomonas sp. 25 TaxID=2302933 RepID=UPI0013D1B5F4|nr:CD225/dispanin family protein [Dysgonomonas sp. 25]NDV68070.1 DUF4339 domain-containing protein [Dysgonomonas sp. 25]
MSAIGYFFIDKTTNQQQGPFSIDELKAKSITPDTMIWFSGLPNWVEAGKIPALSFLFNPSAQTTAQQTQQTQQTTTAQNTNNQQYQSMYRPNVYGNYGAPKRGNNMEVRPMPKSWLIESILVTVFCAQIFGIIAIIYASKVESAYYSGDYETAEKSSKNAKMWMLIGLGITGGLILLAVLFYAFMIIAAVASEV